jgi:hypothetical protein
MFFDDFARTVASVARTVHTKEALLEGELTPTLTASATLLARPGTRARPLACVARFRFGDVETGLRTVQDIVEIDIEVVTKIGTTLSTTSTAAAPAEHVSE